MALDWHGTALRWTLEGWAGEAWELDLASPEPGLTSLDGQLGPLMTLEGLAMAGSSRRRVFDREAIVSCEARGPRLQVRYAPPGWAELSVRATWTVRDDRTLDLEVEASTRTVGMLPALEVLVLSRREPAAMPEVVSLRVEPRDAYSATLSYDGREPDRSHLETGAVRDPDAPRGGLAPASFGLVSADGCRYYEFAPSCDVARRLAPGPAGTSADFVRHAFFGHDLERGVVVRGRLRGVWLDPNATTGEIDRAYDAFLAEPLPLGP